MIANTFIKRPVTAIVISLVLSISGVISIFNLAVDQYPNISPPSVSISGSYTGADAETVERKVAILRQHCADVGRDPADIEISVGVSGSPEELGPKLRSAGASLFTVGVGGPDYDLSNLRNWIAWRDSENS